MTRTHATRLGFALAIVLVVAPASPAERACAHRACRPQKQECIRAFREARQQVLDRCGELATKDLRAACRKHQRDVSRDGIRSCRASARACASCCRTTGDACPVAACGNALLEGGEACDTTARGACPGACRADCTCEPLPLTCGNGTLDPGEACDAELEGICNLGCTPACTCNPSTCGDGLITGDEQCEPGDDWSCPSLCRDDCSCPPPVCGNGVIESGENCEPGADNWSCDGPCQPDCRCAACGNGVVEPPLETCEPVDDTACPGTCSNHSCACLSPSTDTCDAPREIDGFPFVDHQSTLAATTDPGDPNVPCALTVGATEGPHEHSVWYALTAPASGLVTIDTAGSDYDTILVAYAGACDALAALTCNDDETAYSGHQARIGFPVVQGERYRIEAAAFNGAGAGELRLAADFRPCGDGALDPDEQCDPGLPATCALGTCSPLCECLGTASDECSIAPVVTELPVDVRLSAHAATGAASDPLTCGQQPPEPPPSTWFRFIAPRDGTVEITTAGSDYDTVVALFTGECGASSFVACDDDGGGGIMSYIRRDVSSGVTYTLVVTPWFKTLPGRLGLSVAYVSE